MRQMLFVRPILLLAVGASLVCVTGTPAWAGKMAPDLDQALISAGPDELVPVIVLLEEFPSRESLLQEVRGLNRVDRRQHVVSTMKGVAERSQRAVHGLLVKEKDSVGEVRVLWGINGIAVQATPAVIERLVEFPEVRWVLYDRAKGDLGTPVADPDLQNPSTGTARLPDADRSESLRTDGSGPTGGDTSGPNPDADVAPELVAMGAQQVWDELGYTGAGVIVAIIDTGIDRDHPDLADHIWSNLDEIATNDIDDDSNGYIDDTWGWDFCLDNNDPSQADHGTQVAGQVAGDGTNGTVTGTAPDAELMALGIDCDTPSRAFEASDYAIANGAHVISQSYSWWWTDQPDYEAFRRQTDVELAAGVIRSNSAGNHGNNFQYPIPYNISTPANCPAPWVHPDQTTVGGVSSTLAVGNLVWPFGTIAFDSSRGPAAWEDIRANTDPEYPYPMAPEYQDYPYANGEQMGLIKPDISAYGDGTTATCPGTGYCSFNGTSSAAPHVSGALALMLQANPGATPAELAEAIMTTAENLGDPGKDNVYGVGLVQAYPAVAAVESGVLYDSHTIDDSEAGNADLMLDPGERVVMSVTLQSRRDVDVEGIEAILTTRTPGVTIHDRYATYPTLPARGTASSNAPHYSLSIDAAACTTMIAFDLELRFQSEVLKSTFYVRVGEPLSGTLLHDDFESDLGWSTDPGSTTQGAWVREDPIGVTDGQGRASNPEDDTSDAGVACWVTGNGELTGKKDENNNDVDGGQVQLLSPPFGALHLLALQLSYDRWYYDVDSGNKFTAEISNDGGASWMTLEELIYGNGGWTTTSIDLYTLFAPSDDMRLRFTVEDDLSDDPVEGALDEVRVEGTWMTCQVFEAPAAQAPNPVGDTLRIDVHPRGHAVLTWMAPAVDATHDAATLYRIERALTPDGPFLEAGSATLTQWVDIDALVSPDTYFYRVRAENSGGSE